MAPTYKIAVIQSYPRAGDTEGSFNRAAEFIRSSASQGAQLAVLPEYHLTGYAPQDPHFKEAARQWKEYLQRYQDLAKECKINIVPGTLMVQGDDKDEDKLANVAHFIDQRGEILGRYQKKNLWHPERPHLSSSGYSPHEVIQTSIGPVGLLICWDLAFPEAFRELISNGAKIIIIPTEWRFTDCSPEGFARNPHAEALFVDSMLTTRAFENTCAVVFANAGGGPESEGFMGLSQVTVPFIGPLCKMNAAEEGMRIVDLDMTILDEAENTYKIRADLARDDWHYDYQHGGDKTRKA
ncbi:MAG: hypothetical protein M1816_000967 [Peltula sp. TS41687]|nr:MAG: hypothetical protein M1816_000967 [Peltula sp. TS41687]